MEFIGLTITIVLLALLNSTNTPQQFSSLATDIKSATGYGG
jgi:hypothetical protein